jgi:peptidoglycan/xylan/chitin deacetylase (PgdA/CDA1 family)
VNAIFTYHSLDGSGSVISTRPEDFRRQMEALAYGSAKVVPLAEITRSAGTVAITFDDGFGNFWEHAMPVLEQLRLPATVFVVSRYCGGRNNWRGQPTGIPSLPLLSWSALRDLPPAISLGAHTMTHPDLRALVDGDLVREVLDCRKEIEQMTGRPVATFAYPYGAVNGRVAGLVRGAYAIGCGTRLCFVGKQSDRATMPRLDTYYLKSASWYGRPFGAATRGYIEFRRVLREARRASLVPSVLPGQQTLNG